MIKLTKSQARKRFNDGQPVIMCASKMRVDGDLALMRNDSDFETVVNTFHYYNCSKETGLVVHFYKN